MNEWIGDKMDETPKNMWKKSKWINREKQRGRDEWKILRAVCERTKELGEEIDWWKNGWKIKHVCETETQNRITNIYMTKGGKWMKRNKSMNENKKEWINR
jgi:hypothetical protein